MFFELYSKFVGENEQNIIDDFCLKVKNELIGDLTLDEYSRFRFWKHHLSKEIDFFYEKFKKETRVMSVSYDDFCEFMWKDIENQDENDFPEEFKSMMENITLDLKNVKVGEA